MTALIQGRCRYVVVAGISLVAVACGNQVINPAGANANSSAAPATASTPSVVNEVYAIPAADPRDDAALSVVTWPPSGRPVTRKLGVGTDPVGLQPTGGGDAAATWLNSSTHTSHVTDLGSFSASRAGDSQDIALDSNEYQPVALVRGSGFWLQNGDSVDQYAWDNRSPVASYHLSQLPASSKNPTRGVYLPEGGGHVGGIALAPNGDLLAVTSTGAAAAVTDLTTEKSVTLPSYSQASGAAVTADGFLVFAAWQQAGGAQADDLRILRFSIDQMQLVSASDTGLSSNSVRHIDVITGGEHDATVAISSGDSASDLSLHLFELDGSALSAGPTLPTGIGLDASLASGSEVFVYGGPAKNAVSRVDLDTGVVTPAAEYTAPPGSYVIALFRS